MICQPCWVYERPGSRKSMPVSNTVRRLANVFAVVPPPEVWAVEVAAVLPAAALFFEPPPPHPAATSATQRTRAPALRHFARCLRVTVSTSRGWILGATSRTPVLCAPCIVTWTYRVPTQLAVTGGPPAGGARAARPARPPRARS